MNRAHRLIVDKGFMLYTREFDRPWSLTIEKLVDRAWRSDGLRVIAGSIKYGLHTYIFCITEKLEIHSANNEVFLNIH